MQRRRQMTKTLSIWRQIQRELLKLGDQDAFEVEISIYEIYTGIPRDKILPAVGLPNRPSVRAREIKKAETILGKLNLYKRYTDSAPFYSVVYGLSYDDAVLVANYMEDNFEGVYFDWKDILD